MQLTITTSLKGAASIFSLDVPEDLELENFKAFCEAETGVPAGEMVILFNGSPLLDAKRPLITYGISNGDMVQLEHSPSTKQTPVPALTPTGSQTRGLLQSLDFSSIRVPDHLRGPTSSSGSGGNSGRSPTAASKDNREEDPAFIRDMLRANPDQLALLKQNNPRLADALESGNLDEFAKVLKEQQHARAEREKLRIRMLTADPMDLEAQRLIAEEIENKNIEQNMELAMEYNPESFGTVVMLYINCKVNGHPIKAFVDSGAQATIMSQKAAERCNIMRLVDRRWAGIAKGVGTQRILGRVHMAQIQIGENYLTSSFSILEDQPMDMLLGLDMLKRHQCCIDLKSNLLLIGSTNSSTPFLAEADLPECARLSSRSESDQSGLDDVMKASAMEHEEKQLEMAVKKSKEDKSTNQVPDEGSLGASTSSSSSTPATAIEILPSDSFTEDDVKLLSSYGFNREESIVELRKFNGNVREATASLFARSLSPK